MDHPRPDDAFAAAAAAELLQRGRPVPTRDELDRVDRRLTAARAPQRRAWRWPRLATVGCLSVGLLFSTAGSGLALSGFATPASPVRAQYPDSPTGPPPGGGTSPAGTHAAPRTGPTRLDQIRSIGRRVQSTSLVSAETRGELPFTGFAAIPVLAIGIALLVLGALINRRTRAG